MIRALLRPVWRTLPRRALAACGGLGLLLAGIPRLLSGQPDPWLCLNLLRGAALVLGVGLAFLLDDPARHTTAPVPARRPLRSGLRMALVAPAAALWWTVALLLVPGQARPRPAPSRWRRPRSPRPPWPPRPPPCASRTGPSRG
ncbi:hypothetical protein ACFQ51_19900 [Streptomyces kaempferi]